ncbi:MAG TPA: hypothetical protein VM925_00425 [Labilithrix sp.]|nr:hypothetical protein [Labilithrix sp.]
MILNAASLVVALLAAIWILVARRDDDASLAFAAPAAHAAAARPAASAAADAGAPTAEKTEKADKPAAAKDKEKEKDEKKGGGSESPEPIDLAIAPDGGVPFHPGATHFKSPFAKPNAGPAVKVKVGLLLNTVDGYDIKTGTFTADFFLSLTSSEPMPPINLVFPNGSLDKKEDIADKPTFKLYRLNGSFKSPADLRKYPFDSQEIKVILEDDASGIDQLDFVVDKERTQLARGFRSVGWQVGYVDARSQSQSYPDRFENDDLFYSRYTFTVGMDRFATSAAFKVFVPAFVIVIISLLGMWVPADEMEVRSNSGAPMLAGAVLFHFALMQELPATSYLTRADKLMLGVYVSLALGMLSTWCMFLVKEENVPVVFRVARVAVPVLSAITMALACLA